MSNLYNWNAFLVSTLRALLSVLKIRNEQDRACSRSRTTVSSRYTCSRCHVLFSPVSRDRVHLSPFSLYLSCFRENKKLAPKTLIHIQARWQARNNSQKRPSSTCAHGQGHTSNESEKSLRACGRHAFSLLP